MSETQPAHDPDDGDWVGFQMAGQFPTLAVRIVPTADGITVAIACPDILTMAPHGSPAYHLALARVRATSERPLLPRALVEMHAFVPGVVRRSAVVTIVVGTGAFRGYLQHDVTLDRMDVNVSAVLSLQEANSALVEPTHPQHRQVAMMKAVVTAVREAGALPDEPGEPMESSFPENECRKYLRELMVLANYMLAELAVERHVPILFRNSPAVSDYGLPTFEGRSRTHDGLGLEAYAHFIQAPWLLDALINLSQMLEPNPEYSELWMAVIAAHCTAVQIADRHRIVLGPDERGALDARGPMLARLPRLSFGHLLLSVIDRTDWKDVLQAEFKSRLSMTIAKSTTTALNSTALYAVLFLAAGEAWDDVRAETMKLIAHEPHRAGAVLRVLARHRGVHFTVAFDEVPVGDAFPPLRMTRCRVVIGEDQFVSHFHSGQREASRALAVADLVGVMSEVPMPRLPEPLPELLIALEAGTASPAATSVDSLCRALRYAWLGGDVPPAAARELVRLVTNSGSTARIAFGLLEATAGIPPPRLIPHFEMQMGVVGGQPGVMAVAHAGDNVIGHSRMMAPPGDAAGAAVLGDITAAMLGVAPLDRAELTALGDGIAVVAEGAEAAASLVPAVTVPAGDRWPPAPVATRVIPAGPRGHRTYIAAARFLPGGVSSRHAVALGETPEEAQRLAGLMLTQDRPGVDRPEPKASLRLLAAVGGDGVIPEALLRDFKVHDVRDVLVYALYGGEMDGLQAAAVLAVLTSAPAVARAALESAVQAAGADAVQELTRHLAWSPDHPFASAVGSVRIGELVFQSAIHDGVHDEDVEKAIWLDICAQILGLPPPLDPVGPLPKSLRDPALRVPTDPASLADFDVRVAASAHGGEISDDVAQEAILRMVSGTISRVSLFNLLLGADASHASWAAVRGQLLDLLSFRPQLALETAEITHALKLWSGATITIIDTPRPRGGLTPSTHWARIRVVTDGGPIEVDTTPLQSREEALWRSAVALITAAVRAQGSRGRGVLEPSKVGGFKGATSGYRTIPRSDGGLILG